LRRLAVLAKRQAELRQQMVTALTYPVVLILFACGVSTFLIMGIIPKFVTIFLDAGVALPLPTALLYGLSVVLRRWWWVVAAAVAAGGIGLAQAVRVPAVRRRIDAIALKVPVAGDLVRKASLCQLTRTLETLFSSGVPVLESLAIAEQTCGNMVIAEVMRQVQTSVRQGGPIALPMKQSGEFPPMVVQMITVGEASGTIDTMLGEVAGHYEELVQNGIKRLMSLVEPVLLVVMGGMVAFIMASVLLPLFRMVSVIR
jgi:type IV pilus assembly protein PilC